jgi:hypothetical protein
MGRWYGATSGCEMSYRHECGSRLSGPVVDASWQLPRQPLVAARVSAAKAANPRKRLSLIDWIFSPLGSNHAACFGNLTINPKFTNFTGNSPSRLACPQLSNKILSSPISLETARPDWHAHSCRMVFPKSLYTLCVLWKCYTQSSS